MQRSIVVVNATVVFVVPDAVTPIATASNGDVWSAAATSQTDSEVLAVFGLKFAVTTLAALPVMFLAYHSWLQDVPVAAKVDVIGTNVFPAVLMEVTLAIVV